MGLGCCFSSQCIKRSSIYFCYAKKNLLHDCFLFLQSLELTYAVHKKQDSSSINNTVFEVFETDTMLKESIFNLSYFPLHSFTETRSVGEKYRDRAEDSHLFT